MTVALGVKTWSNAYTLPHPVLCPIKAPTTLEDHLGVKEKCSESDWASARSPTHEMARRPSRGRCRMSCGLVICHAAQSHPRGVRGGVMQVRSVR